MTEKEGHKNDTVLAGEYVLHLLDATERRAFESRLNSEPALHNLVRDWEAGLAPLAKDIAPVLPPARLKTELERSLFPESRPASGWLWRWISGGLVAASLIAGGVLLAPTLGLRSTPVPALSASVASEDGSLVIAALYFDQGLTLEVERQTGAAFPGRVLELWLIAEGAAAPVSLGVLSSETQTSIDLSTDIATQLTGAVLAVSDEPLGGSPTGAPTGVVLATGVVTNT